MRLLALLLFCISFNAGAVGYSIHFSDSTKPGWFETGEAYSSDYGSGFLVTALGASFSDCPKDIGTPEPVLSEDCSVSKVLGPFGFDPTAGEFFGFAQVISNGHSVLNFLLDGYALSLYSSQGLVPINSGKYVVTAFGEAPAQIPEPLTLLLLLPAALLAFFGSRRSLAAAIPA